MLKKVIKYLQQLCVLCYPKNIIGRVDNSNVVRGDNMKELTVFDVANFFRSKGKMTHKKLQKLVYYAYVWYIALYNENVDDINNKLFNDGHFEAWVHGPVCPELYHKYSDNYGVVKKYNGVLNGKISGELQKFLEMIYKTFGKYTGDDLESMTHQEAPWINARGNLLPAEASNNIISTKDMFTYYNNL